MSAARVIEAIDVFKDGDFDSATGRLAKTDQVDAKVLAKMGVALCLKPTPHPDKRRAELAGMMARREDIKAIMRAENCRFLQARLVGIKRAIRSVLRHMAKRLVLLETRIEQHVQAHNALRESARRLQTMPGIGPILSASLIDSLSGLAPHARDSGLFKGKRRIWGGRANVRRTLYLAAFIASCFDPTLRIFRNRLEAAGKPTKIAIVATARKLVTILNAMMKNGCDYQKSTEF